METYHYILDKSPKKHTCPDCGKVRFVRYIDTVTGQYLQGDYGRCDRESNCNYHKRPPLETLCFFVPYIQLSDYSEKSFQIVTDGGTYYLPKSQVNEVTESGCYVTEFYLNESDKTPVHLSTDYRYYTEAGTIQIQSPEDYQKPKEQPVHFMPEAVLNDTLKSYENNTFIQNLIKLVPATDIEKVISLYRLGTVTNGTRAGAVTFPFIDKAGNIRTIQAKQFDETNHTQKNGTDFIHSIIKRKLTGEPLPDWLKNYQQNERFVSCLFGEHLLNHYPLNPVALVEAPKTAIIGALYYGLPNSPDQLLWLAVYNKSSLTLEKCKALKGRKVVLFPDLNAFNDWSEKAKEISANLPGTRFIVSDILEKNATEAERTGGLDLADYLTRFDYKQFRKEQTPVKDVTPPTEPTPQTSETPLQCAAPQQPEVKPQATTDPEIWQVIEKQFTDRLNPDDFMQPGKPSDEIFSDLTFLSADCLINYGLTVTPDQYYNALNWRKTSILNKSGTTTHVERDRS